LIILLALPSVLFAAEIDPSFKFSTIETAHFKVHFHEELREVGERAAQLAEEAHCMLEPVFKWTPYEKTNLVIIDNMDFANGFTSVLPYNLIYIFAVPPQPDMTIGQYEDWLRLAIIHEYAHVLTMDPSNGYSGIMREIFGKPLPGGDPLSLLLFFATVPPNVLMPDWWLEGMATWAETQYAPIGRGRNSYYEMIFRMAVADNNIPSVDKINGDVPYWPDGHLPYIYGLALQRYIAKTQGNETLGKLNTAHSSRFPYFISEPPKRLTGKNYALLYKDMINDMKEEQRAKIGTLGSMAFTNSEVLDIKGEMLSSAKLSKDGIRLALQREDPHEHDSVIIFDYPSLREIGSFRRLPSDRDLSWSPDGTKIYFTQADLRGGYNLYQDLYYYDLKRDKIVRLTKGVRIKEPDASMDGNSLAVVIVNGTSQSLGIIAIDKERPDIKRLIEHKSKRISTPRYSPDGKLIVYSVRDEYGNTSLNLYDIATNTEIELLKDRFDNQYPVWSPDGSYIVFISDRNGVYNLYAYSIKDKKVLRITHLLGGAFYPEVSPDSKTILFSSYTSRGFRIEKIPYDPSAWSDEPAPTIKPYWPYTQADTLSECKGKIPPKKETPRPYSAFGSLAPRFWLPTLRADHDGVVLGAFTAGQDALGYHTYIVEGGYGLKSGYPYYDATYIYDRFYPTLMLRAYREELLYRDFFNDKTDLEERIEGLSGSLIFPIKRLESRFNLIIGYKFEERTQTSGTEPVFEGRRDAIFGGFTYSDTLKYPYSISKEEGRSLSFIYRNYSKKRNSEVDSEEYIGKLREYLRIYRHNVLVLDLRGGASSGDRIPQQAFQLGGIEAENEDFPVRGYPPRFRTGKYIATASLEYRMPIWYIFKGPGTKPFFLDRLHAAAFTDAGVVWDDFENIRGRDIKVGAGIEARLDTIIGYKFKITPAIGIAHGFSRGGETRGYITIYVDL